MTPELLHHYQAPWLYLRGVEPSQPVLQRETQNGSAEAQNPEPLQHHHQNLLSGKHSTVCVGFFLSFYVFK